MKKLLIYIRTRLKQAFDNITNERLKDNLLQAIPFWIASVITGLIAVLYAKIFGWGELLLFKIIHWKSWLIFIITPFAFVLSYERWPFHTEPPDHYVLLSHLIDL